MLKISTRLSTFWSFVCGLFSAKSFLIWGTGFYFIWGSSGQSNITSDYYFGPWYRICPGTSVSFRSKLLLMCFFLSFYKLYSVSMLVIVNNFRYLALLLFYAFSHANLLTSQAVKWFSDICSLIRSSIQIFWAPTTGRALC